MDLWQRINNVINSTLSLHDRVDISGTISRHGLKFYLEEMSQVLKMNHIPLIEVEEFVPEFPEESIPLDTTCPGQSSPFPLLIVANIFQVVISAGSARGLFRTMYGHLWWGRYYAETTAYSTG